MLNDILQEILKNEMDKKVGYSKYDYMNQNSDDSRNRYSKKLFPHQYRKLTLTFQGSVNRFEHMEEIEDPVLTIYAKGITPRDISAYIKNIFDVDVSQK